MSNIKACLTSLHLNCYIKTDKHVSQTVENDIIHPSLFIKPIMRNTSNISFWTCGEHTQIRRHISFNICTKWLQNLVVCMLSETCIYESLYGLNFSNYYLAF